MTARRTHRLAVLAVALLLTLPSVAIGFYADDYVLRAEAARVIPDAPPVYDPLGSHVMSIAWYLGLVWAVGALFGRVLPAGAALLAAVVFAIDPAQLFPWGWAWQGGHLLPLERLPIGHSLEIAWSPGPIGML